MAEVYDNVKRICLSDDFNAQDRMYVCVCCHQPPHMQPDSTTFGSTLKPRPCTLKASSRRRFWRLVTTWKPIHHPCSDAPSACKLRVFAYSCMLRQFGGADFSMSYVCVSLLLVADGLWTSVSAQTTRCDSSFLLHFCCRFCPQMFLPAPLCLSRALCLFVSISQYRSPLLSINSRARSPFPAPPPLSVHLQRFSGRERENIARRSCRCNQGIPSRSRQFRGLAGDGR